MSDKIMIIGWVTIGVLVLAMLLRVFLGHDDDPKPFW